MADTDTQIGFEQIGLAAILRNYQLIVPTNQRDYAWEEKEVTTLFKDLELAINTNTGSYFLGTIVTIPRTDSLEVVDGQQRLATTAILLSEIRDYIGPKIPKAAESLNPFLGRMDRDTLTAMPSLTLNLDDNEYFCARLNRPSNIKPTKPSHKLLKGAFSLAEERVQQIVAGIDEKDEWQRLNKWVTFLEKNAEVILLKVPNVSNAYRIFETLNDRGKRASQSDLVKNHLFAHAGSRLKEVQQRWTSMKGALESLSDDEDLTITFLRHAIIVVSGFVREKEVYEAVQKNTSAEGLCMTFADQLEDLANWYTAIQNPDNERWNDYKESTCRALAAINLFDIVPMRPLLLAAAKRFSTKESDLCFRFLVSLCVRLMFTNGTRTGSTEKGLAEAANKVFQGKITSTHLLISELKAITSTDPEFKQAFETATVTNHRFARYYLRSLEMAANSEREPWHIPNKDPNSINLEHVLPQRPEENWPEFDADQARLFCKRLGNLVLVQRTQNTHMQNLSFSDKRKFLKESAYTLTKQVGAVSNWTSAEIEKRQQQLALFALKAWPLNIVVSVRRRTT